MHEFTIYHFGAAAILIGPSYFIVASLTKWMAKLESGPMNLVRTVAAVYLALIFANVVVDHNFKISKIGVATVDASHDVRDAWHWGKRVRKQYG